MTAQKYSLQVVTPTKSVEFTDIVKCQVTTDYGQTVFLSGHSDFLSTFTVSTIKITSKSGSLLNFSSYRGLIYFSNKLNSLVINCIGFDIKATRQITDKKKILEAINKKDFSKYTLKILENEKYALEKIENLL